MKILTTNFLTCAVKACKSSPLSFPLHVRDAVLERSAVDYNPLLMKNLVARLDWAALRTTATELGLAEALPPEEKFKTVAVAVQEGTVGDAGMDVDVDVDKGPVEDGGPNGGADGNGAKPEQQEDEEGLRKLHGLLLETAVVEGKLVCGNCGFEYPIKDGVANFLLPAHLV